MTHGNGLSLFHNIWASAHSYSMAGRSGIIWSDWLLPLVVTSVGLELEFLMKHLLEPLHVVWDFLQHNGLSIVQEEGTAGQWAIEGP